MPRRSMRSGQDNISFWSIYTVPLSVGNPSLHLDAVLDTSWSPFFVPSINCTYNAHSKNECIIHPLYNSSTSSTYYADLSPCKMIYWGLESIRTRCRISSDSLHLSELEIKHQVFEEATTWEPGVLTSTDLFDTVLGLALHPTYDQWGNFSAPGPFQNLIQQKLLKENIFSLTLPMTKYARGELIFGALPDDVTRSDLIEVPLNNTRVGEGDEMWDFYTSNGWQISVHSIAMIPASSSATPILSDEQIAIVTTSYPYIGLPLHAVRTAHALMGHADGRTWAECHTRVDLPDLIIDFRPGMQVRLTPEDYFLEVWDAIFRKTKCVSAYASLDDSAGYGAIILGSPFLTGLYSVFDADRSSISFGKRI